MIIIIVIEFKNCETDNYTLYIIVYKYGHKKEFYLVIMLIVDKNLEINLYYTILSLSLAIFLWVKDNRKFLLNTKEIT